MNSLHLNQLDLWHLLPPGFCWVNLVFLVVTQKVVLKENVIKSVNKKKLFLEFLQWTWLCLVNTVGYIRKCIYYP